MNLHAEDDVISPVSSGAPEVALMPAPDADRAVASRTRTFDNARLRKDFTAQDAFLYLEDVLAPEVTARLIHSARSLLDEVNRNYLPGHKQGGSVSRRTIDRLAPFIAELYRSKELIGWLEQLSGDQLQVSPADDPHAYALYYYTRPGDHIGWH